jgi:hypothetical protein
MHAWLLSAGSKALPRLCLAAVLSAGIPAGEGWIPSELAGAKAAFADDDDGGDDDGGGRGSGASRGGERSIGPRAPLGGNLFRGLQRRFLPRAQRRAAVRRPAAPQPPPPVRAPDEIVATGLTTQHTDELAAGGFAVLGRENLPYAGSDIVKLRIPTGATLEAARDQVRSLAQQADVDFNH